MQYYIICINNGKINVSKKCKVYTIILLYELRQKIDLVVN